MLALEGFNGITWAYGPTVDAIPSYPLHGYMHALANHRVPFDMVHDDWTGGLNTADML